MIKGKVEILEASGLRSGGILFLGGESAHIEVAHYSDNFPLIMDLAEG